MPERSISGKTEDGTASTLTRWSSLGFRDYRFLWVSTVFAGVALQINMVVNYYLVYELTGSTIQLGLTGLFQVIPLLLLGLFGGTLADLMDRKVLMQATLAAGIILALFLWALARADAIEVWHIFGVVTVTSLINVFGVPARMSMMARTVPEAHLMNAFTINTATMHVSMLIGPIVAGFLVERWIGIADTYLVSALLFVPAIVALLLVRTSGAPHGTDESPLNQGIVRFAGIVMKKAWEGARFVWSQRIIVSLLGLDIGVTVVSYFRPLLAAFAKDVYGVGPVGLGTITSALSFGSILGSLVLLLASRTRRKGLMVLGSTLLYGISLGLFGVVSSFWIAVMVVGALGFLDSIAMTIKHATVQIVTPDHLRGRAASVLSMASMGANSLGALEVGLVAAYLGPRGTMLLGGGISIAVVLVVWVGWRHLREYRN